MVDFRKKLGKKESPKKLNPRDIYDSLDRESDKGPLRPIQEQILDKWFESYKAKRDVILKLHTGQGKTLVGLLILQSRLNQTTGPAMYLCPNNYLVDQTCEQAKSFGINYCVFKGDLPDEFIEGKSILITSVQTLFNGLTKFKTGAKSESVSTILMDDAHACVEVILNAFKIKLTQGSNPYQEILNLFSHELENQGVGTFADIKQQEYGSFLPVPYWDWQDKHREVAGILSKYSDMKEIKFSWNLIKDIIRDCQCVISGKSLEIVPHKIPLHLFGSYFNAEHRIYMSATLADDAFLVKGLGLNEDTIQNPLYLENEKWSGEKMVLIPSLIDPSLNRTEIVHLFAKPRQDRQHGVVALVPSFNGSRDWEKYEATVAQKDTILSEIERLKDRDYEKTLVIANRYDGIDLPDQTCRILVLDSKPVFESLIDRYIEDCRSTSDIISLKLAQIIEQGMGRAVRGEKDYCVVVITGAELVRAIRAKNARKYFSHQTNTQIEVGLEIAEYAKEEIEDGKEPTTALGGLVSQALQRDDGWKEFYVEKMNEMDREVKTTNNVSTIYHLEHKAENHYCDGNYQEASNVFQEIIDNYVQTDEEKGWYLQEMARCIYPLSHSESNKYQVMAHKRNRYLLKPREGMAVSKLSTVSLKRIENLIGWIHQFTNFEELQFTLEDILNRLRFGVRADRFEQAFDELARTLGFASQRPDKEWKEGPDNLWKLGDNQYLIVECKSNVDLSRSEIHKDETGQMNNACAWFNRNYGQVPVKNIMIIPPKRIARAAGFNCDVEIMRDKHLKRLTRNVRQFYFEFKHLDLDSVSEAKIQQLVTLHKLSVEDLMNQYSEPTSN